MMGKMWTVCELHEIHSTNFCVSAEKQMFANLCEDFDEELTVVTLMWVSGSTCYKLKH